MTNLDKNYLLSILNEKISSLKSESYFSPQHITPFIYSAIRSIESSINEIKKMEVE